jgi:hypothetical protein
MAWVEPKIDFNVAARTVFFEVLQAAIIFICRDHHFGIAIL